ncbi:MAG: hypothetical protein KIS72_09970 [Luteimonas sp.]|nr:hypothetical protein [Luteimonas sp.]
MLAVALEAFGALALVADARLLLFAAEAAQDVGAAVVAVAPLHRVAPGGAWVVTARLFVALAFAQLALLPLALCLLALAILALRVGERTAVRVAILRALRRALARGLFVMGACARMRVGDGLPA